MRRETDGRREGALRATLLPRDVTARCDGALVVGRRLLAVLGLAADGVVLFDTKEGGCQSISLFLRLASRFVSSEVWAHENPRVVCLGKGRAARHDVSAVRQVNDFGVAFLEEAFVPGGDVGNWGGNGKGQQEREGSKRLHFHGC